MKEKSAKLPYKIYGCSFISHVRRPSVVLLMSQPSDGLDGVECECFGMGGEAGGLLACSRGEGRLSDFSKGEGRSPSGSE